MTSHRVPAIVGLLIVLILALAGCGGGSSQDDGGKASDNSDSGSGLANTCVLISAAEVGDAVGTPVKQVQHRSSPYVTTGGTSDTCTWLSTDPQHAADQAMVIFYSDPAACDEIKKQDSPVTPIDGVGDSAFSGDFASVTVYVGTVCFQAQWYSLDNSDEESQPLSLALAKAVVAKT